MNRWKVGDLVWIPAHTEARMGRDLIMSRIQLTDPSLGLLVDNTCNLVKVLITTAVGPKNYFFARRDLYRMEENYD